MFDIVIPTYNTPPEYLEECLDGIERQTIPHTLINVLLINDGGAPLNLEELKTKYTFNLFYDEHEKNEGPGAARQCGVDFATNWIVFCDADDVLEPDALEELKKIIDNDKDHNLDIIYADRLKQKLGNSSEVTITPNRFPDNLYGLCINKNFLQRNSHIRFLPYYYHEDGLFTLLCSANNPNITLVHDHPLITHRVGNYESLAGFHNPEIYDLSMLASAFAIYAHYLDLKYHLFIYDEEDPYCRELVNRCLYICGSKDLKYLDLACYFLSCIWHVLPQSAQYEIQKNNTIFDRLRIFNGFSNAFDDEDFYYEFDFKKDVQSLCTNENLNIQTYFLEMGRLAHSVKSHVANARSCFPKCTVIIPSYNNSTDEISAMMNSLMRQSACLNHLEFIIVDDGSTNGVLVNANRFFEFGDDVKIIYLPQNRGVGAARQTGLAAATTKYVMFCDMDDEIIYPDLLYHYFAYFYANPDCDVINCAEVWFDGRTGKRQQRAVPNSLHGMICDREALEAENIQFKPWQYGEDGMFALEVQVYGLTQKVLTEEGYYRKRGHLTENVESHVGNTNSITDQILMVREYTEIIQKAYNQIIDANATEILISLVELTARQLLPIKNEDEDPNCIQLLRDAYVTPKEKELYIIYYLYELVKVLPERYLKSFLHHNKVCFENPYLMRVISAVLMKDDQFYLKESQECASIEEIKQAVKRHFFSHIEKVKQINPDTYIPHQAIKHEPWNYETYTWK